MESISSIVKKLIDVKPFIHESIIRGIVSYANLAEILIPDIKKLYGAEVKQSAVVMALRRHADELKKNENSIAEKSIEYELTIKTNILDVNIEKRESAFSKLMRLHQIVSMEKGDFLNITIGSNEIGIAISQKYQAELDLILAGEIVLHQKTDLVAVSVLFTGDFLDTPGIIYEAVRKLAWEHINVLEIVTTMNELTFVINREDSSQAYEALQRFL